MPITGLRARKRKFIDGKTCPLTSGRLSRRGKPEVPADAETHPQGAGRFSRAGDQHSRNGSFLDLTGASCLFSPLALPGRSAELDSPLLFFLFFFFLIFIYLAALSLSCGM